MPHAASVKRPMMISVKLMTSECAVFDIPEGMPGHMKKVSIFPDDDLESLFPQDRYPQLHKLTHELRTGRGGIDHLRLERRSATKSRVTVQLAGGDSRNQAIKKIENTISACGHSPQISRH